MIQISFVFFFFQPTDRAFHMVNYKIQIFFFTFYSLFQQHKHSYFFFTENSIFLGFFFIFF